MESLPTTSASQPRNWLKTRRPALLKLAQDLKALTRKHPLLLKTFDGTATHADVRELLAGMQKPDDVADDGSINYILAMHHPSITVDKLVKALRVEADSGVSALDICSGTFRCFFSFFILMYKL